VKQLGDFASLTSLLPLFCDQTFLIPISGSGEEKTVSSSGSDTFTGEGIGEHFWQRQHL